MELVLCQKKISFKHIYVEIFWIYVEKVIFMIKKKWQEIL